MVRGEVVKPGGGASSATLATLLTAQVFPRHKSITLRRTVNIVYGIRQPGANEEYYRGMMLERG